MQAYNLQSEKERLWNLPECRSMRELFELKSFSQCAALYLRVKASWLLIFVSQEKCWLCVKPLYREKWSPEMVYLILQFRAFQETTVITSIYGNGYCFLNRKSHCNVLLPQKADSASATHVTPYMKIIRRKLKELDSNFILNVNESIFFFKLLPHRSYICAHKNQNFSRERKQCVQKSWFLFSSAHVDLRED